MTDEMKMAIKLAKIAGAYVGPDACDRCYNKHRRCVKGYCRVNVAKMEKLLKGKLK